MIWKKSWWETRWLFLIGLVAIFLLYGLTIGGDHYDAERWAARLRRSTNLSENERQALNNYQGQTWAIWFKLLFSFIWADFAVVMGAVCLMTACPWTPSQGATGLFTFSLPASRRKILLSQAAAGFGEMFLFALIPSLLLPIIAYCRGQWFSLNSALIYALLMVFGGAVLFCFSFLLAVVLSHWFMAFLLAEAVVFALYLPFIGSFGARPWWNVLGVMAGESYFYQGQIPWRGLLISLILSAVFIFTAIRIYERRDL
jgi:ABC-2 type transport system permease protein